MATIGRPREFDRGQALEAAMMVFWRKGYAASSMSDLIDAMGIKSPSLYAAFGGKEALYIEAVDHYADTVGPLIWGHLDAAADARTGVRNLLLAAAERMSQCDVTPGGCMVTLAGVGEDGSDAIKATTRRIRATCLEMLRTRLAQAVADGELPASTDIDRAGRFYLSVYQGIAIQARDGAPVDELEGIVDAAMAAWPL